MSAIGKGDWIQCVEELHCRCGCGPTPLRKDAVYVVESVCHLIADSPGVTLQDVPTPGSHHCFPLRLFKPLGGNSLAQTRKAPQDVLVNFGPYFKQPVPAGFEPWD